MRDQLDESQLTALIENFMDSYNTESSNQLAQANHKVEEVKFRVQDNLNEVVKNQGDIEVR